MSENVTRKLQRLLVTFKLGVSSRLNGTDATFMSGNQLFRRSKESLKNMASLVIKPRLPTKTLASEWWGMSIHVNLSVKQLNLNWWSECYKISSKKRGGVKMYTREPANWALRQWIKWNMKHALGRTDAFTSMMEKNMSESNIRRLNNRAPPFDMNNESSHLRIHKSQNFRLYFLWGHCLFSISNICSWISIYRTGMSMVLSKWIIRKGL